MVVNPQPEPDLNVLAKKYKNLGRVPISGKESVIDTQAWLRFCERFLESLGLTDNRKRLLASWLLKDEASIW